MKLCPQCNRLYPDESLRFCLDDGELLVSSGDERESPTAIQLPASSKGDAARPRTSMEAATALLPASGWRPTNWSGPKAWLLVAASTVFVAFCVVYLFRDRIFNRNAPITSIAVLPFKNRGGDADTQYLSEGLAESLIYRLSQIPDLRVSPTSSVFRYEDRDVDPIAVGNELGVNAVLSGRIVQHGDRITISADLVDIKNNRLLWGEHYERPMSQLLDTQREIAREIVENLKIKVSPQEQGLAKHYTENNEAYKYYLKGRFYWDQRTANSLRQGIGYFDQAIEMDPTFALAYAGLADCYVVPANQMAPNEAMPKAKAAAIRAIELDDSLAEAHTSLGRVMAAYEWNWAGAEREFKRAIELNPRYPVAHQWYGGLLQVMGEPEMAIAERKTALELDPLSLIINFELGQAYYYAHDFDGAIEQYQKTLQLDPKFPPAYQFLPAAYEQKGNYDEAIKGFRSSPVLYVGGEFSLTMAGLGHAYAVTGQTANARAQLEELKRLELQRYIPPTSAAMIYAGLGEKDNAFVRLDKAVQEHAFQLQWLMIEPRWDNLHSDPRFAELLKRIGLPFQR